MSAAPGRAFGGGPVLALEASTRRAGVALLDGAGELLGRWMPGADLVGTAELGPRTAALLADAGLTAADLGGVAVGLGPGSYTGLRSAIALARGLAFGAGLPLAGLPSVAAAARAALLDDARLDEVIVLLDARRGEWYRADYRRAALPAGLVETAAPHLMTATPDAAAPLVSSSSRLVVREPLPDPYHVAVLGRERLLLGGDAPSSVLPLYLKRSHAELALERKSARQGPARG